MTVTGEPGVPNIASHVSHERVLHWKDADAWLAYNKRFGRQAPTDTWLHNVESSANHYALMKVFGSRPRENFADIVKYAQDTKMGTPARVAFDKRLPALENRFKVVSGEADRPIANMWSGIVNGVMAEEPYVDAGDPQDLLHDVGLDLDVGAPGGDKHPPVFEPEARDREILQIGGAQAGSVGGALHRCPQGRLGRRQPYPLQHALDLLAGFDAANLAQHIKASVPNLARARAVLRNLVESC